MLYEAVINADLDPEKIGKVVADSSSHDQADFLWGMLQATQDNEYDWYKQSDYIAYVLCNNYTDQVPGQVVDMLETLIGHIKDYK
jgi:thiamine pyrophosphate-dependent acetolactate synthase large subunit-like protein